MSARGAQAEAQAELSVFFPVQPRKAALRCTGFAAGLVALLVVIVVGRDNLRVDRQFDQVGVTTSASVLDRSISRYDDGTTTELTVAFLTTTGRRVVATLHKDGAFEEKLIAVRYLPTDPARVRVADNTRTDDDAGAMDVGILAASCFLFAVATPWRWARRSPRRKDAPPRRPDLRSPRTVFYERQRSGFGSTPTLEHPSVAVLFNESGSLIGRVVFQGYRGPPSPDLDRRLTGIGAGCFEVRDPWNELVLTVRGPVAGEPPWVVVTSTNGPPFFLWGQLVTRQFLVYEGHIPFAALSESMHETRDDRGRSTVRIRSRTTGDIFDITPGDTWVARSTELGVVAALARDMPKPKDPTSS